MAKDIITVTSSVSVDILFRPTIQHRCLNMPSYCWPLARWSTSAFAKGRSCRDDRTDIRRDRKQRPTDSKAPGHCHRSSASELQHGLTISDRTKSVRSSKRSTSENSASHWIKHLCSFCKLSESNLEIWGLYLFAKISE